MVSIKLMVVRLTSVFEIDSHNSSLGTREVLYYLTTVESIASFTNHLLLSHVLVAVCLDNHEILGSVLVDAK